jgi:4-amino-4-deoxy-L-arabinose transferase-like glycosyltransferase
MYRYVLRYNLEWYPSLGGTIAYYPLFVPFLFMLSYSAFGISFSSAYLVVIIMGNICVITTFLLGSELFDRRIGLLAALFLAFSSIFFVFSKTSLLDIPSATMFTLSIYSLVLTKKASIKTQMPKKQSFLTGLFIGLAFMTKPTCGLIFPTIILYFALNYVSKLKEQNFLEILQDLVKTLKENLWVFYIIIPILLLIGFQLGIFIFANTLEKWFKIGQATDTQSRIPELSFYITGIGLSIPELGGVLIGLIYSIYKRTKKDKLLLSWYFVVYFSFSFVHKEARYFLIAFPAMFILLSRAIIEINDRLKTYHPRGFNTGTIIVIAIIFLFGLSETLRHPYGGFYSRFLPQSETSMEEAALFLIEKEGITMQMTMNPTISPSAMNFYTIKHDRDHQIRYYNSWWATKRGQLSIDEFKGVIKQLKVSYLLLSDPGNMPSAKILDKYVVYVVENPQEFSLVRVFDGEYSIYIYKVRQPF